MSRPDGLARFARARAAWRLFQQAADPHRGDISVRHIKPAQQTVKHPIRPVQRGRARAARQPHDRNAAQMPDEQEVAGIDRHAKSRDLSPRLSQSGGPHILRIGCGRSGEDQHDIRGFPAKRISKRARLVRDDLARAKCDAEPIETRLGRGAALGSRGLAGNECLDQPGHAADGEMPTDQPGAAQRLGCGDIGLGNGIGDDLDRCDKALILEPCEGREGRERERVF